MLHYLNILVTYMRLVFWFILFIYYLIFFLFLNHIISNLYLFYSILHDKLVAYFGKENQGHKFLRKNKVKRLDFFFFCGIENQTEKLYLSCIGWMEKPNRKAVACIWEVDLIMGRR